MSRKTTVGEQIYQPEGTPDDFQAELEREQKSKVNFRLPFATLSRGAQTILTGVNDAAGLLKDDAPEDCVAALEQAEEDCDTLREQIAAVRRNVIAKGGAK